MIVRTNRVYRINVLKMVRDDAKSVENETKVAEWRRLTVRN